MYIHTLTRFCESRRRFSSLLSLKYISYLFFCLSDLSLLPACCRAPPRSPPPLPRRVAIRAPLSSLPSCLPSACPPLLSVVCSVAAVPFALSPSLPLSPSGAPLKLSGGLPSCLLCLVVLWWLPSLVRHQAQNGVTVWADAACICPRPCLLLPMCCRVFRRLIRVLSRGFRPCVRVCVLLPCVVWW